jgi:hypothetical protein
MAFDLREVAQAKFAVLGRLIAYVQYKSHESY